MVLSLIYLSIYHGKKQEPTLFYRSNPESLEKMPFTAFSSSNMRLYLLPSILTLTTTVFILSIYFSTTLHSPSSSSITPNSPNLLVNDTSRSAFIKDVPQNYPGSNHSAANDDIGEPAGIIFYTGAVPMLSIIHTLGEGSTAVFRPTSLKGPSAELTCLWISGIMAASWTVNNAFWLTCDVLRRDSGMCPVQIRNDVQLSTTIAVAKTIFAWSAAGGYAMYLAYAWASVSATRRERKEEAKRLSEVRLEALHVAAVSSVVESDE